METDLIELLSSTLSDDTKHEILEWFWAHHKITDEQYKKLHKRYINE